MACAHHTPAMPATSCTAIIAAPLAQVPSPRNRVTMVTAGLKCAPDIGPSMAIST